MFFGSGYTQLGKAVCSITDVTAEVNFTADTVRIISHTADFAALGKAKTYSSLLGIMRESYVRSEDHGFFDSSLCVENVVTRMLDGEHPVECELRLNIAESVEPLWYMAQFLRANSDADFDGHAILVITNIAHHKEVEARAAELSEWVDRDPLTGFYNKQASQKIIDEYLSGEGKNGRHTLLFCDLDDFKTVNDTLGHPFGDALLSNISDKFGTTFRREDILCRIGGDEFIILMKNTSGRSYVAHRADVLLDRMKQALLLGDSSICVTMSIGIANYPDCGTTYAELMQSADKAMYVSKNNGKNQYCFCDESLSGGSSAATAHSTEIEAEQRSGYRTRGKLSDYIFNCLYESTDLEKALPLVLQLMGTHFSLGRVAIAEIQDDRMVVTRQWNASGIEPLTKPVEYTGELRALFESSRSSEFMALRYNSFDDAPDDVRRKLLAADIDDVRAFIHCPLLDGGVTKGYIAFFDCQSTRNWSDEERDTLSYAARLVSLFVFRQRAQAAMIQSYEITRQLLDNSPVAISFIDPKTCEMLCISRKAQQDVPYIETGTACPMAPLGSTEACKKCPMYVWKNNGADKPCTIESYDPRTKEWLKLDAVGITLEDGREVCLCGRLNIDPYKQRQAELEEENARLRARLAELSENRGGTD